MANESKEPEARKDPTVGLMPLQSPPREDELEEPEKFVPSKDHQSYDTPSGRALAKAGAPIPEKAGTDSEEQRGLKYLAEKFRQRWLA